MTELNSKNKKSVLIISGEPCVLAELKMGLAGSFGVRITNRGEAALTEMQEYKPDAVIIWIGADKSASFQAHSAISGFTRDNDIPVLFLAEHDDGDDEAAALNAGAADYAVRRKDSHETLISRINLRIKKQDNEEPATLNDLLKNKTIMVVDDVALNRELLMCMLPEVEGLSVETAGDGSEAVEKFTETPDKFSLIFMDVHMPNMDGVTATKMIRRVEHKNARAVPIVALTATSVESDHKSFLEAGMNAAVLKPLSQDSLKAIFEEYYSK